MGVAQKTMFSISDRLAKFFGISGAPMEHNTTAKSKQTFFYKLDHFGINGPGLYILYRMCVKKCALCAMTNVQCTYCIYICALRNKPFYLPS